MQTAAPEYGSRFDRKNHDFRVMAVVGIAHAMSHFAQLVLPLLSPRMTVDFGVNYTQLGFVLTVFFASSFITQTASGFIVDTKGPRPILLTGLTLIVLGISGYALSTSYWMLLLSAVALGVGNGVFHPADYTLLNWLVKSRRLAHAYSAHGITGTLGWALAPVFVVPIAAATSSWRIAMGAAAALVAVVLLVVFSQRRLLGGAALTEMKLSASTRAASRADSQVPQESTFAFLKLPAIWMCMGFFFFYALSGSAIQTYAAVAVHGLFGLSEQWAAYCVTFFMVASMAGMVWGGFLASDPSRCEKIVGVGFGCSATVALGVGFLPLPVVMVPVMFMLMGFATGIAGPSRDLIVKRATPARASGRVFGIVYAGLDIGQGLAPMIYGRLMDHQNYAGLFIALAVVQGVLIASAFNVRRTGAVAKSSV